MPTVDYERLIWENYPSEDTPINAENLNHLEEGVAGLYHDQSTIESEMAELSKKVGVLVGAPLVATLAVNMIDKTKVYVYTGSETGYTAGNWYYWDGTQWQSGGVYNAVAVNTDKTLTVEDMAADGKATGQRISEETKYNLLETWERTGNPIILEDGGEDVPVKDLKVTLEPKQDLHGYENPWPAGGGKNLLQNTAISDTKNGVTFTVNANGTINANGTATGNAYIDAYYDTFPAGSYVLNGCPEGGSSSSYRIFSQVGSTYYNDYGSGASFTLSEDATIRVRISIPSGTVCNNLLFKPMIRLASVSDATFEPYSNICPITGYDGVDVVRCGKNLCDNSAFVAGSISGTGVDTTAYTRLRSPFIKVSPNTAYSYASNSDIYVYEVHYYDKDKKWIRYDGVSVVSTSRISDANAEFVKLLLRKSDNSVMQVSDGATFQMEKGSTATGYEPYKGTTFTTNLGRTVYSGVLDVTKGLLTVDKAIITLGDISEIGTSGTGTGKYVQWTLPSTGNSAIKPMSERMTGVLFAQRGQAYQCYLHTNNSSLQTFVPSDATVSSVNAALSGSKVLYSIASPLIYHLTPTEVTTLLGHNLISSNGRMELTYRRNRPAFFERDEMYNLLPTGDLSGNPAYCDDGGDDVPVKDMTITLEPIQDLHGYDHPWPAGGGKNLLKMRPSGSTATLGDATATWNSDGTITLNGTSSTNLTTYVSDSTTDGNKLYLPAGTYIVSGMEDIDDINSFIGVNVNSTSGAYTTTSKSSDKSFTIQDGDYAFVRLRAGAGVTYDNTKVYPMIRKSTDTETWEPYTNICPITGMTDVGIVRRGKNLIDANLSGGTNNGITFTVNQDKSITVNGTNTSSGIVSFFLMDINAFNMIPGKTYKMRLHGADSQIQMQVYSNSTYLSNATDSDTTFTIPSDSTSNYVRLRIGSGQSFNNLTVRPVVVEATDSTDWEPPYTPQTVTTDLGRTVYGGTLDVTTGVLTVDMICDVYDGSSDEGWSDVAGGYGIKNSLTQGQNAPITNMFPGAVRGTIRDPDIFYNSTSAWNYRVGLSDTSVVDLTSFKAWLSEHPIQVCCKLAIPQTYHLDKEEITTLLGFNTFTTNAKTLDLTYRKDLGLYIKKLIETT